MPWKETCVMDERMRFIARLVGWGVDEPSV